ncbi:MAG: HAMP domain-containing protein, partial [Myxococcota bacterium]|nr:HAMP domain-containing protein [Myxococcota bacterium]
MKITTKIWGSVSLLIVGYLVTTGLNYYFGGQNERRLNLTGGTKFPASLESQMVSVEFAKVLKHYEDGVMLGELEAIETGVERRTEVVKLLREISSKDGLNVERAEESETIAAQIEKIAPVAEKAYTAMANMEDLDDDVDPQKIREALLTIQKDLVALADSLSSDVQVELDSLEQESKNNRRVALILMLVVVTASLTIMIFVTTRYISTPLRRMVSRVQDIAEGEGDLTRRIRVETRDEVGDLGKWFNVFLEKLQGIIRAVGDTTETLTLSAEDLAATSLRLTSVANRTTDQANLVSRGASGVSDNSQHAAQAVEQMTSSISEISEGAQEAALVAQRAVSAAAATNQTMTKLADSSADIGKITKV